MNRLEQKIVVIGLGYIGLPTASMLATKGHRVVGVDINEYAVDTINSGNIHIIEPDLDLMVRAAVNSGNLRASLIPEKADAFILAVPTPFKRTENNPKAPDISYVEKAVRSIAPHLDINNLIILESTSPVGTTDFILELINELRPDLFSNPVSTHASALIYIAHCPERVLPGHILRELVDNDRVIGGINLASAEKAKELYKTFCNGNIYLTDARTAEMTKLVENSFRDVNIAFANELSMICETIGINVWELIQLANKHPRVNILRPGPGVGGHCIAVDPWFIVAASPENSILIKAARQVNEVKPRWVIEKVKSMAALINNPTIGCLGLTFKADIDDIRESPALLITRELIASGVGRVMVCEPNLADNSMDFPLYNIDNVLKDANIICVLVDHAEFKDIDREQLKDKIIIDSRGIWS